MGQTLTNGLYLPDEGERYCYSGLASNWTTLDAIVGGYNAHVVNTTIHITSEERIKWNANVTQSYVLSYASSSVSANSTVAYSSLDNVDNIKIGDKVLDQDGKLYPVTAVDSANSQITAGSLLIDLSKDSDLSNYYTKAEVDALDSNAVHKSGAETISGQKTFSVTPYIYNSDSTGNTPYLYFKSSKAVKGDSSGSNTDTARIVHLDKNNKQLSYIQYRKLSNGSSDITLYCSTIDDTDQVIDSAITFFRGVNGVCAFRSARDNEVSLGDSSNKWKDVRTYQINGFNPGVLSLPSQSYVDISGYFTNTGTGEFNTYTAPSDGWIFLRLGTISSCQAKVVDSSNNLLWGVSSSGGVEMITVPILSGCKLETQWATGSNVNVATARFIPCLGNI